MDPAHRNLLAQRLRALCQPGNPLILTNVYDAATARLAASHPSTKALATASYAIAQVAGTEDAALDLATNLSAIRAVATVAAAFDLPLTADLQDGYADVAASVRAAIAAGAVGCNLEDVCTPTNELRSCGEQVSRIQVALRSAAEAGVPDFVLNARTDVLACGGSGDVEEAVARGQAYLEAGAATVYVWGGAQGRGVSGAEVARLVEGLDGRVNVKMNLRAGFAGARELAGMGVARISVGPEMFHRAMRGFREALDHVAGGREFE